MPASFKPLMSVYATMTTVGVTENVDLTATRPYVIADYHNVALATSAASTAQLSRQALGAGGFNVVSAALTMDTANALTRAATLVAAQVTVAATDVLRNIFTAGTGAASGFAVATLVPTAISGQA